MVGQGVLRVAGCDISLFDDCLEFGPYASIGSYHKGVIPFLKGDKAFTAAGRRNQYVRSAMMVNSMSALTVHPTIDAFAERLTHSAAFAAGRMDEPEEDEFANRGDASPQAPHVSARAAIVARSANVKTLAGVAPPQYVRKARGTPNPRPEAHCH